MANEQGVRQTDEFLAELIRFLKRIKNSYLFSRRKLKTLCFLTGGCGFQPVAAWLSYFPINLGMFYS